MPLSDEVRARIEEKKQAALAIKRKRLEERSGCDGESIDLQENEEREKGNRVVEAGHSSVLNHHSSRYEKSDSLQANDCDVTAVLSTLSCQVRIDDDDEHDNTDDKQEQQHHLCGGQVDKVI